jgi:hypothetical protein
VKSLFNRIDVLLICVIVLSAIFPSLGIGAYFRNEDARVLVWISKNINIFYAFDLSVRYIPSTFRPVYETLLRIIYFIYGNNPLAFQVISGFLFIGSILFLYNIVKVLLNRNVAFFFQAFFTLFTIFIHQFRDFNIL